MKIVYGLEVACVVSMNKVGGNYLDFLCCNEVNVETSAAATRVLPVLL